jgi:glycosyltransferase XagB
VKLIVEDDDEETLSALEARTLPTYIKVVEVPDAPPKTKPKACNFGLAQAEGSFVVIYDAEDRPEPDQLKKVVAASKRLADDVICIQCKLNYFNRDQNLLTRWFTGEYSMWFDLFLPALVSSGAPIPLGGTSNHFRTESLRALGGWDPYNVTEDADLGIRLHKAGYRTVLLDSTTFEEANPDLANWIRQRSRWVKGYIQTWLVHMRHPIELLRQIGWQSWLSFQLVVAGTFLVLLISPVYWIITGLWFVTRAGFIHEIFPGFVYFFAGTALIIGNFLVVYVTMAASLNRRYFALVKYTLLSPVYWALMSIGAWKGVAQLVRRSSYWEKTEHGLAPEPSEV